MKALFAALTLILITATATAANDSPPDRFPGGTSGGGGRMVFVV